MNSKYLIKHIIAENIKFHELYSYNDAQYLKIKRAIFPIRGVYDFRCFTNLLKLKLPICSNTHTVHVISTTVREMKLYMDLNGPPGLTIFIVCPDAEIIYLNNFNVRQCVLKNIKDGCTIYANRDVAIKNESTNAYTFITQKI